MIKFSFLAIFLCTAYCSASQPIIPRFETLGVNDGLPHSSVYSILQDKKGFMWFGTADGLCRYDGTELKTFKYTAKYAADVVNNFVRGKMLEDLVGNIWYCNETGIYKWDILKELVIRVRAFDKKYFNNADSQALDLDDKKSLWIFSLESGIVEYNIISDTIKQYPLPSKVDYTTFVLKYITKDNSDNFWLRAGSKTAPFVVFNKRSHQYSTQLKRDPPQAIFFDNKKRVLIYEDKLVYEDGENSPPVIVPKMLNGKPISFYSFDATRDSYDRFWMTARGNGLFYFDEKNKIFQQYRHSNSKLKSLPFDLSTCLFIDRNENLWIGIDGGGVAKLDLKQPKFNLYPLSEGDFPILNDYFTKCFYEDEKSRIWFGSQTNGLNIFDPVLQSLTNYQHEVGNINSLPGNMVGSILKDKEGSIWIGSSGGISLFDEGKRSFKTIDIQGLAKLYPMLNNFVYRLLQLDNGDFLAATLLGLMKIVKEETGNYKGYYFGNNKYLTCVTTDVAEMVDKTIYATMPGIGLCHLEQEANGYKLVDIFLNGIDLRSVRKDEKLPGYLWIGSGKGLIHFNTLTHTYKVWDEKNGMANSYVYGSLEDSAGNLWFSTNKGLSSFNRQQNSFENYSFLDGLQSNEFNTQAFYKSRSGNFYFGGIRGFNWFRPGYVSKEKLKPIAAITLIEINGAIFQHDSAYFLHHTITVPYDKNDFNFQFASLDYTRPEANKVHFVLEGWDNDPVITENKTARYANLPPGTYTLRLKVSNADGVWSNEEKVTITIQSPFWKRIWFLTAVILLLLVAIIFITYRFSQLKAKRKLQLLEKQIAVDAERNRISADMHDEIGSGITHIALLSELIQTQQKDAAELKKDISKIATSARWLVQTMGEIIWALNPQNDTLENLLAYTREQSHQYFESMDVEFDINFPDIVPDIKLSNAERRNLYLVTRESLNNAMKHSGATLIQLKLEITIIKFCFTVSDNGKGMNDKQHKPGTNGLANMRKRMEDIGGSIRWYCVEQGTAVEYCFPIK
ncbi:MAG: two-component regulator propeller domain-containing protein [Ferruginibacter sp.]